MFNITPLNEINGINMLFDIAMILPAITLLYFALQLLRFAYRYPWRFATLLCLLCHLGTLVWYGLPYDRTDDTVLWTLLVVGLILNFILIFHLILRLISFSLRQRRPKH